MGLRGIAWFVVPDDDGGIWPFLFSIVVAGLDPAIHAGELAWFFSYILDEATAMATAEEAKKTNIEKMGAELGVQYSALWQEVALLHRNWGEYTALFGTKPSRIDLINRTAPYFFRMVQDDLLDATLLYIARLTDPPKSAGRTNLTIKGLPDLIGHEVTRSVVGKLIETAAAEAEFCRDWRNRRIAHRDLDIAQERSATELAIASRKRIKDAIGAIAAVLNAVSNHFLKSETRFDLSATHGGSVPLLYVLHAGLKAQNEREERLKKGEYLEADLDPADL
jgi:hypothetical protein